MSQQEDTPSPLPAPPFRMTQEQKDRIVKTLQERGALLPCPRCGHTQFTILDGYFYHVLQFELPNYSIGGAGVPAIGIACTNCGFLSEHALGALGLLPEEGSK